MFRCMRILSADLQVLKTARSTSSISQTAEKWDLLTAVCVERCPIITPPLNDIEVKFQKVLRDIEFERSYKNDWELKQEQEKSQQSKEKDDVEVSTLQTVQDFIYASADERSKFKEASRITEADKNNDQTSLDRKLDKHLVLLLEEKLNNETLYLLPQGKREEGETLRQAAERVLKEKCGNDIRTQFLGNAPAGFYKYKYPKDIQSKTGSFGAKVFIYTAYHKAGQVSSKDTKFKWLDRNELEKNLSPSYHKSISAFLIDE